MSVFSEQLRVLAEKGPDRVSPLLIPMLIGDIASGHISMRWNAKGPNYGLVSACATGNHSIGEASWIIRRGDADIMIAGGAEAPIVPIGVAGFCSMKAMSQRNDDPLHASRPFDRERDGFVMSEGSGLLFLEELEHAKARGAHIIAEMIGYGASCDGYHITSPAPGGEGGVLAFKQALKNAEIDPSAVDYVNAHGTSTHLNDLYETQALKTVFGDHARKMAISSTKGTMGHGLGAAGGFETIICAKAIETGIVPPTINYEYPDPECDLDYTPNTARKADIKVAVNTNLGFGGHNGVMLFKKFEQ
jgi:3-oxoacyl-[acyl-carrier-protein] synthase II